MLCRKRRLTSRGTDGQARICNERGKRDLLVVGVRDRVGGGRELGGGGVRIERGVHVELGLGRHRSTTRIEGRVATVHRVILALSMMNLGRKATRARVEAARNSRAVGGKVRAVACTEYKPQRHHQEQRTADGRRSGWQNAEREAA